MKEWFLSWKDGQKNKKEKWKNLVKQRCVRDGQQRFWNLRNLFITEKGTQLRLVIVVKGHAVRTSVDLYN